MSPATTDPGPVDATRPGLARFSPRALADYYRRELATTLAFNLAWC